MPYTVDDVDKHKAGLTDKEKGQWVAVANSVLKSCVADGGDETECAAKAIQQASGVLKKQQESEPEDDLAEAVWTAAQINLLPDSSFALILPGGEKDEEGKTTPRGLRKLPFKDADGKVDEAHLRNALARAPQMKDVTDAQKAKAIKVLQSAAEENLKTYQKELGEVAGSLNELIRAINGAFYAVFDPPIPGKESQRGYRYWIRDTFMGHPLLGDCVIATVELESKDYAVPFQISGEEITFVPNAEWKEVRLTYEYVGSLTSQEMAEIGKRLSKSQLDKLRGALSVIEEVLKWGDYADEPATEEPAAELAEASFGHVLSMGEKAVDSIVPLHLDVALIQPGWGNKRDNHYYPREVIERDAKVFEGVKMYESDHGPDKNTRLWVSTVKEMKGFTDDGAPIALVSVHDKNFAERLIALDADGLLQKMEVSILAAGTAKKGEVDGKKGHIVEAITSADSVDYVTRAGAGGKVLALSEKEEATMPEEIPEATEGATVQESEPVVISEQEPVPAPAVLPEKVAELVKATNLPEISKERLLKEQYADEATIGTAIQAEIAYVKELTGSGKPFAQGGGSAEPAQLTEEEKTRRFNNIMFEVGLKPV